MSIKAYYIVLFLCLPLGVLAQRADDGQLAFYTDLAYKDAHREQSTQFLNSEDETDFWKDQISFEQALKQHDKWGYQIYLNAKRKAYMKYQDQCNDTCAYSDMYYRQASYYAINGAEEPSEKIVLSFGGNN